MLTVLVFNVAFIENLQLIHNIKMINQQNQWIALEKNKNR